MDVPSRQMNVLDQTAASARVTYSSAPRVQSVLFSPEETPISAEAKLCPAIIFDDTILLSWPQPLSVSNCEFKER